VEKQGERKKMAIERCDKCGKAFMSQSEVERHKMYEHPVPVPPFVERVTFDSSRNNGDMSIDDLHRLTTDVMSGKSNSNNDITTIGSGQIRKVPFRTFRT
jgi:hypothetical protein